MFAKWVKISLTIFLANPFHLSNANAEKSISSVLRDVLVASLEQALKHEWIRETILLARRRNLKFLRNFHGPENAWAMIGPPLL